MFFWNSLAFSTIQRMFKLVLKPAWTSGGSRFTYCWSLAWRILTCSVSDDENTEYNSIAAYRWDQEPQLWYVNFYHLFRPFIEKRRFYLSCQWIWNTAWGSLLSMYWKCNTFQYYVYGNICQHTEVISVDATSYSFIFYFIFFLFDSTLMKFLE